jgi:hypothetical protein
VCQLTLKHGALITGIISQTAKSRASARVQSPRTKGRNPSVSEGANAKAPSLRSGFLPIYDEYQSTAKKWQTDPAMTNRCQAKWL